MTKVSMAVAAATLALSTLTMPVPAGALAKSSFGHTAQACQLSIPTTDTQVRPKATGYNNEGTKNAFVICGFADPAYYDGGVYQIILTARSLDGATHSMTCTSVNGLAGVYPQTYSSKTLTVPASASSYAGFAWDKTDFDTDGSFIPYGQALSVTCTLPPHVGLVYAEIVYDLD